MSMQSTSDASETESLLDKDSKGTIVAPLTIYADEYKAPEDSYSSPDYLRWFAALEKDKGKGFHLSNGEKKRLKETKEWFQDIQAGNFVDIRGPIIYDPDAQIPPDLQEIQRVPRATLLAEKRKIEGLQEYKVPPPGHYEDKKWVPDHLSQADEKKLAINFIRENLRAEPSTFSIEHTDHGIIVKERKAVQDDQTLRIYSDLNSMGDICVRGDAQLWLQSILRPTLVSNEVLGQKKAELKKIRETKAEEAKAEEKETLLQPIVADLNEALKKRKIFRKSFKQERENYKQSLVATNLDPAEVDSFLEKFDADRNSKREELEGEVAKHKRRLAKVNKKIRELQSFFPSVESDTKYINKQIRDQWQEDIEKAAGLREQIRALELKGDEESLRQIAGLRVELKALQDEINDQTKTASIANPTFSAPDVIARYLRKARKDVEKKLKEAKAHNETIEDESERLHHYLSVISPLQEHLKLLTYAYTRADILCILRRKIDKEKGYKFSKDHEETGAEALARVPAFAPESYETPEEIERNNFELRLALLTGRVRITDIAERKGWWRKFKDGTRRFFTLKFGYLPNKTIDREEALRRAKAYKTPRDVTIDQDKLVGYKFDWDKEREEHPGFWGWFVAQWHWICAQFTFENYNLEREKEKIRLHGYPRVFFGLIPTLILPLIPCIPIVILISLGYLPILAILGVIPALALSFLMYKRPGVLSYWWRSWGRRWTVGGFFSLFKVVNSVAICFTFTYLIIGWPMWSCIAIAGASAISAIANRGPSMLDAAKYSPKEQRVESEHPLKPKSGKHLGFRLTTNFFMVLLGCLATGATSWFAINPIAAKVFGASVSAGALYFIDILIAVSAAFSFYAFQGTDVAVNVKKYKKLIKDKKGWTRFGYILLSVLFFAVYAFVTWFTVGKGMVSILGIAPGSVELTVALVSATTLILVSTFSYVYKVMDIINKGTWKTLKNAVKRAISWVRETYKNNRFWGIVAGVFIAFILIIEIPLDLVSYPVAVGWTTSVSTLLGFNVPTWLSYFIGITVVSVLIAVCIGFSWVVGAEKVIKLESDKRKQEHEVSPEEARSLAAELKEEHPGQNYTEVELPQYKAEQKEEAQLFASASLLPQPKAENKCLLLSPYSPQYSSSSSASSSVSSARIEDRTAPLPSPSLTQPPSQLDSSVSPLLHQTSLHTPLVSVGGNGSD